jgi:hypothetical protein
MNGGEPAAITVHCNVNVDWKFDHHSSENNMKALIADLEPECNYILNEVTIKSCWHQLLSIHDELPNLPTLMEVIPNIDSLNEIRRFKLYIAGKSKIGGSHILSNLVRMLSVPVHFTKKKINGHWVTNQKVFKLHKLLSFYYLVTASNKTLCI